MQSRRERSCLCDYCYRMKIPTNFSITDFYFYSLYVSQQIWSDLSNSDVGTLYGWFYSYVHLFSLHLIGVFNKKKVLDWFFDWVFISSGITWWLGWNMTTFSNYKILINVGNAQCTIYVIIFLIMIYGEMFQFRYHNSTHFLTRNFWYINRKPDDWFFSTNTVLWESLCALWR